MPERTSAAGTPGEELAETLTAALDGRLAAGGRGAGPAVPRRRAGPPAGPHGLRPGGPVSPTSWPPTGAGPRWRRSTSTRRRSPAVTGDADAGRAGPRQAGARADRGRAHRLRGRLRRPRRRGGGRRRRAAAPLRWPADGDAGSARRSGGSGSRASRRPPGGAGMRTLTLFLSALLGARAAISTAFVVTLPKMTSVDQVEAMVDVCRSARGRARPRAERSLRFELQIETPQSILGPDGTALVARMIHAGGRPVHRAALRHLRLLRVLRHPGRVPEHGAPGGRPRQAGDAGGRRRHRRAPLGRLDQRAARRRRATRCARGWELHARLMRRSLERGYYQGWDLHPGAAAEPVRGDLRLLPRRVRPRPPGGCATTSSRPSPASWTSRLPPGRCRTSSSAACDCGAVSAAEVQTATGLDAARLTALARPRRL